MNENKQTPLLAVGVKIIWWLLQGSYRQVWEQFKDFSRTSKSLSNSFQGLKVNEKYWSKCSNSTSEMLDWDNGDINTGKLA